MLNDGSYGFDSGTRGSSCLRTRNPSYYSLPSLVSLITSPRQLQSLEGKSAKQTSLLHIAVQPGPGYQRSRRWWLIYSPALR